MLNAVFRTLRTQGWIDPNVKYELIAQLTRASGICLILTRDGIYDTYVKFSPSACYDDEAARAKAAHDAYPNLTARFLGRATDGGLDILASRAVAFVALPESQVLAMNIDNRFRTGLQEYFSAMPKARIPPGLVTITNYELPDILRGYFETHEMSDLAMPILNESLDKLLNSMPPQPQHGDFVLNNMGVTSCGLILFDWEDYARIQLPGLDLYTLLMSLGLGGIRQVRDCAKAHSDLPSLVAQLCQAMHLPLFAFESLIPAYILTFLFLKRAFAREVQLRMETLLLRLPKSRGEIS